MPDLPLLPSDSEYSLSSYPSLSDSSRPQTTAIDTQDLPVPTTPQPFPTKKSHARKQPQGHIPRPRNAFILFRCDYTRQKQPTLQQYDQNGVSRLVGEIWRNMNADQREPWVLMAEAEKKKHAALYPGYKFNPRSRKQPPTQESVQRLMAKEAEKVVTVEVEVAAHAREEQEEWKKKMVEIYYPPWATRRSLTQFARRAMSCPPPGAIGVEPYSELVDRAIVTTDR
ncbi:high mobility group box domain-containing protein [Roridomyces roridus]|uniref:High mobility group box domain-containing protein n=1 Tax=Roridomyces roridus TaxID=1738132 RepID=A0AAD7C7V4_9AGAR|nr:high mobility group box domain-containing protein [Roridomyces roridus]